MKKLLKYALLAIMAFGFVGCGGDYGITYNTNPIGANIICGGVGKGLSPLTLYYDRDGIDDDGFLYTTPCKAVFSSGYVDYFDNKWDTNKFHKAFSGRSLDHRAMAINKIWLLVWNISERLLCKDKPKQQKEQQKRRNGRESINNCNKINQQTIK